MSIKQDRQYYVYILTNATRRLYVGVTNDLERRLHEHKNKFVPGFAAKYNISWLAYYEQTSDIGSALVREKQIKSWRRSKKVSLIVGSALVREKQIKSWRRSKKVSLIESVNSRWKDLSLEWQSEPTVEGD